MKLNTTLYLLISGFIFVMLVFGGAIYYIYKTEENLFSDFNEVENAHAGMNDYKKIENLLDNLETSIRAYKLSNDKDFLASFDFDCKTLLYEIKKITANLPPRDIRFKKLTELSDIVSARIALGKGEISLIQSHTLTPEKEGQIMGKESDLKIRLKNTLAEITDAQQSALDAYHETVVNRLKQTHRFIELVGFFALVLSFLIVTFFYQYHKTHGKVEHDLMELNENKNKFFSIISHDLRGPVKNIALMAQLLHEQKKTKSVDPEKIAYMIESSAKNLSSLLDNLLKWSRLQMNKIEFQPEKIDIQKLIDDVIMHQMVHAIQKNIAITSSVQENVMVHADQNMINTVLRNLISNSLKFTNKGGYIELSGNLHTDSFEVIISDNGVGMPKEIADKIFSIDFKHTTKGTNKEEGTGLGLKLCKEFINKNQGDIRIESVVGEGSKFIFSIPLARYHS